eukprot:2271254-Pleurochrysis_carterae.AAC.1
MQERCSLTHFNGERPFLVCVKYNTQPERRADSFLYARADVEVRARPRTVNRSITTKSTYTHRVFSCKSARVWVGRGYAVEGSVDGQALRKPWRGADGNTVLLCTSEKERQYVVIGASIYSFKLPEAVDAFYSVVGSSNVPQPTVLMQTYVALLDLDDGQLITKVKLRLKNASEWQLIGAGDIAYDMKLHLSKRCRDGCSSLPNLKLIMKSEV